MKYRRLGRNGVKVSEVSLGGWLTHGRSLEDQTTTEIVRRAFDLGINFFDTADVYNRGEAELSLGKAVEGIRREELFIATKCYFPFGDKPNDRGLSRKHIAESVNNSLKRLNMDYIDLMQFHRFDAETPLDETVRAIDDLIRQGKVFYWGVSEWSSDQIADVVAVSKELEANPPASNQPSYSMLNRRPEAAVIPTCGRHGLGMVVFSPLAQGILTGKYKPGQPLPAGSRGADESSNMFMKGLLNDETLARVEKLEHFAQEQGHSLATFALAWCLRKHEISSVIIGATSIAQLEENAKACDVQLPTDVWERAEAILEP